MSLPDEFADVFAGVQDVPDPATAPVAAATPTAPLSDLIPDQAGADSLERMAEALLTPEPSRTRMGAEATDLPPLPRPDLPDLGDGSPLGESRDLRLLAEVQVELAVELGRVKLPLRDLLSLAPGAVLELDRSADAPVDVLVNGCLVARGEVVVIDGEFGVRITAVVER
jgi:flagellar motor switch protein FliN/FliY